MDQIILKVKDKKDEFWFLPEDEDKLQTLIKKLKQLKKDAVWIQKTVQKWPMF